MPEPLYRYFAQQQFNAYTNTIVGFELLLKCYEDGRWQAPRDFNAVPVAVVAGQLVATTEKLAYKTSSVSVNLTLDQLRRDEMRHALKVAQAYLRPTRLVVELVESSGKGTVKMPDLIAMIQGFTNQGIGFSLDDVGSGENRWPVVEPLLDYVQELKYALQNNRETLADKSARDHVTFWQQQAQAHHLRFILEGVETDVDIQWADKMELDLRQGYYYSKPELIRVKPSDPHVQLRE